MTRSLTPIVLSALTNHMNERSSDNMHFVISWLSTSLGSRGISMGLILTGVIFADDICTIVDPLM